MRSGNGPRSPCAQRHGGILAPRPAHRQVPGRCRRCAGQGGGVGRRPDGRPVARSRWRGGCGARPGRRGRNRSASPARSIALARLQRRRRRVAVAMGEVQDAVADPGRPRRPARRRTAAPQSCADRLVARRSRARAPARPGSPARSASAACRRRSDSAVIEALVGRQLAGAAGAHPFARGRAAPERRADREIAPSGPAAPARAARRVQGTAAAA